MNRNRVVSARPMCLRMHGPKEVGGRLALRHRENDPGLPAKSDPPFAQEARLSLKFPAFVCDRGAGGQIVALTRIAARVIILPGAKNAGADDNAGPSPYVEHSPLTALNAVLGVVPSIRAQTDHFGRAPKGTVA